MGSGTAGFVDLHWGMVWKVIPHLFCLRRTAKNRQIRFVWKTRMFYTVLPYRHKPPKTVKFIPVPPQTAKTTATYRHNPVLLLRGRCGFKDISSHPNRIQPSLFCMSAFGPPRQPTGSRHGRARHFRENEQNEGTLKQKLLLPLSLLVFRQPPCNVVGLGAHPAQFRTNRPLPKIV